jgi:hypothetical protein
MSQSGWGLDHAQEQAAPPREHATQKAVEEILIGVLLR